MKLDSFLRKRPLDRSIGVLCDDAPAPEQLSLDRARELISHQRNSQVPVLAREMYGPLLATEPTEGELATLESLRTPRFEFNDPGLVARVFLRAAAQVGASLAPFQAEHLAELDRHDASLGRFLRLLAIAEGEPIMRDEQRGELVELILAELGDAAEAPFGPVLTPMLMLLLPVGRLEKAPNYFLIRPLVNELAGTDRGSGLAEWTTAVVEAGALHIGRISYLRIGPSTVTPTARESRTTLRGAHARDVVLAGDREANSEFLEGIHRLPGVETQTRFIYEPEPGLVRIRAWSEGPLEPARLTEIAADTNARIVQILDDTLI